MAVALLVAAGFCVLFQFLFAMVAGGVALATGGADLSSGALVGAGSGSRKLRHEPPVDGVFPAPDPFALEGEELVVAMSPSEPGLFERVLQRAEQGLSALGVEYEKILQLL